MIGCPTSGRYGCSPLNPRDEIAPIVVAHTPRSLRGKQTSRYQPNCASNQLRWTQDVASL